MVLVTVGAVMKFQVSSVNLHRTICQHFQRRQAPSWNSEQKSTGKGIRKISKRSTSANSLLSNSSPNKPLSFVGDTPERALRIGHEKTPDGMFHLIRVGHAGAYRVSYSSNASSDWLAQ